MPPSKKWDGIIKRPNFHSESKHFHPCENPWLCIHHIQASYYKPTYVHDLVEWSKLNLMWYHVIGVIPFLFERRQYLKKLVCTFGVDLMNTDFDVSLLWDLGRRLLARFEEISIKGCRSVLRYLLERLEEMLFFALLLLWFFEDNLGRLPLDLIFGLVLFLDFRFLCFFCLVFFSLKNWKLDIMALEKFEFFVEGAFPSKDTLREFSW